ncbi:CACNG7 [Cordylochernes scorpioides]|uniref:CACNG7 n=1 Tax=Cordylochernes scorpioides TaxID=51811 RepID=A0ABY6JW75_9ARAC|nr:CACNG7 [Cordylochernes scorpioides]
MTLLLTKNNVFASNAIPSNDKVSNINGNAVLQCCSCCPADAVKRAALFIFASTATLVAGMMLGLVGCLLKRRPVIIFIAGIIFILSVCTVIPVCLGLFILAGIVIYISTFKAEVGNKLRPKSSFQGPMFKYQYGFSFLLAVASLMLCELAGTFAVFLYIRWYQLEARRRREELRRCRKHPRGSLQDIAFLPFSRDTTCNTVSTDITRNHSREFSLETLRRTTPV